MMVCQDVLTFCYPLQRGHFAPFTATRIQLLRLDRSRHGVQQLGPASQLELPQIVEAWTAETRR